MTIALHQPPLNIPPANSSEARAENRGTQIDLQYVFDPKTLQGIALLTSSDSTKSLAAADYDDCVLVP
jgi:hypothetical protein